MCAGRLAGLPQNQRSERTDVDVAEGDRTMVALNHQRVLRGFGYLERRPRRAVDVDVLLDELSVEEHADEAGVLRFLAGRVKARRSVPRLIRLPLAGPACGVDERGRSADTLLVDPPVVDGAGVRRLHAFDRSP